MKKFKKPKKYQYNIVIIGAGSGGLVSSLVGATVKAKVALIEKHKMGGDCLNTGCVPSKALIRSAKAVKELKKADKLGIEDVSYKVNFKKIMEGVHDAIKTIAPHDSIERYTKLGVECYKGTATILSPWEVQVETDEGKQILTTKNIIISTGARPFIPPIPNIDKVEILTSDSLWDITELPKRLVVMGGGPIGSELSQAFARIGSKVTQIETKDRIIAVEDPDASAIVQKEFEEDGVEILTEHRVVGFDDANTLVAEYNDSEGNKQTKRIGFDRIILAVGRRANVTGYGLEDLDIKLRKNKTIESNEFLQTNYPNIYVCGDITGPYQFTHTAAHQAWYAAVNALFGKIKKFKVDYSVIPWCTYTDPEIARVGLSETDAQRKKVDHQVSIYHLDLMDRAVADRTNKGFVKVITEGKSDKILGATVVHAQASTMILEFISAMKNGFGLNKIIGTIHIYPSLGEANKYAAGVWKRKNVNPNVFKWLEKFQNWMRK